MVFVDGENLAIRYGDILKDSGTSLPSNVIYEPNTYIWAPWFNAYTGMPYDVLRTYYYTSVQGDEAKFRQTEDALKNAGIEAPKVFRKAKGRRSKRVDISLATDMLTHAHRANYDIAILFAGDEDYVPLVEAVMNEGRRVHLRFVQSGLSPALRMKADTYTDLSELMGVYAN